VLIKGLTKCQEKCIDKLKTRMLMLDPY